MGCPRAPDISGGLNPASPLLWSPPRLCQLRRVTGCLCLGWLCTASLKKGSGTTMQIWVRESRRRSCQAQSTPSPGRCGQPPCPVLSAQITSLPLGSQVKAERLEDASAKSLSPPAPAPMPVPGRSARPGTSGVLSPSIYTH